jgi:hypothetical protein
VIERAPDATATSVARCRFIKEAAMEDGATGNRAGTSTGTPMGAPGTLAKFHLGLAADGTSCAMVFVDEQQRSIACIAGFTDLDGFINSLMQAAAELARRRSALGGGEDEAAAGSDGAAINVASSHFRICDEDGSIMGALVSDRGQVVDIRMRADVANQMTRNMLRSVRPASAC